MKVKFKKAGRWAHENQAKGQFEYKEDEVKEGISENDCKDMVEAGIAEVVGVDDVEVIEDEKEDEDEDEKKPFPLNNGNDK